MNNKKFKEFIIYLAESDLSNDDFTRLRIFARRLKSLEVKQ